MRLEKKYHLFIVSSFLWCHVLTAQITHIDSVNSNPQNVLPSAVVKVGEIDIVGNKKTKKYIILRELPFKKGDSYTLDVLVEKFEVAKNQLMNSTLFNSVVVAAKNFEANTINITVAVKERWYLFPLPYFKPVDRNLNQWLVEQKANLNRVEYGAKLNYYNVSGVNDKLRFRWVNGYTKQLALSYDRLYIDKKLKWGAKVSFNAGKNKEINYATIQDKQAFFKEDESFVRRFVNGFAEVSYRRAIKTRHTFGFGFSKETVSDTIIKKNPSFFTNGRKSISFPELSYSMIYFDLNYIPYPTKGYALKLFLRKRGLNSPINIWEVSAQGNAIWPVAKKTFFDLQIYGGLKAPFRQPYYNQRFLGYGEIYLQGYEYFVIDGAAGGFLKATIAREMFNFNIKVPAKKGKEKQKIPIRIFGKVYGNTGYVYNPEPGNNFLSNKMLYSGGFGIDIVTFYDVTFKLEYSFNAIGQNGLFLHRKSIF